jgi:hypothetical protein
VHTGCSDADARALQCADLRRREHRAAAIRELVARIGARAPARASIGLCEGQQHAEFDNAGICAHQQKF